MPIRTLVACVLALPLLAPAARTQVDRYELGLRLRDFERQLGAAPRASEADRTRVDAALRELDRAVQAFFRLDTKTVALAVDAAATALDPAPRPPGAAAARALQLAHGPRLVARGTASLAARVTRAFPVEQAWPTGLRVRAEIEGTGCRAEAPLDALAEGDRAEVTFALPFADVPAGDHVLRWSVLDGDTALTSRWQGVSVADDAEARIAALPEVSGQTVTMESATLAMHRKLLTGLTRERRSEETVLPGHRLLAEAEALAALPAEGRHYDPSRTGQFWLRVPVGRDVATVRWFAPPGLSAEGRAPVVVALHGAGGSENLFFDGYGDGEVVRQCAARGWFCVAPRAGLSGPGDLQGLVAALARRWPVDPERVLVVGHSMGAAMAMAAAAKSPRRYRAVAALGGGGGVPKEIDFGTTRFFVGAGSRDFALAGARSLGSALEARGAAVERREYPGVEHLAIVQLALPDVFVAFEAALAGR